MTIPSGFEFTGAGWYDRNTGAGPYAYDGVSMTLIAGGGASGGGGGVSVLDANGDRWLWVYDQATGTSTFVAFSTGVAGTPVYPLEPDADSAINVGNWPAVQTVSLTGLPVPLPVDLTAMSAGAATEAKQDAVIQAVGDATDAPYAGAGQASAIAALKGIYDNTKGRQQVASWAVATGVGTIAAGATEVSFANIGAGPGLIGGSPIPFGLAVVFSAMAGCTLDSIDYDATGTTIYISEVR